MVLAAVVALAELLVELEQVPAEPALERARVLLEPVVAVVAQVLVTHIMIHVKQAIHMHV